MRQNVFELIIGATLLLGAVYLGLSVMVPQ